MSPPDKSNESDERCIAKTHDFTSRLIIHSLARPHTHAHTSQSMRVRQQTPVELRYEDLVREGADLSPQVEAAFGAEGLGLLTVSGVPGVAERRRALLPLARRFALLPEEVKRRYEHAASSFSFGWSHGKEKLQGRPDVHKGSYYANPLHDRPTADATLVDRFPAFYHPNIWPREENLPELEPAFKAMGQLIVEVCVWLGRPYATHAELGWRASICPHAMPCTYRPSAGGRAGGPAVRRVRALPLPDLPGPAPRDDRAGVDGGQGPAAALLPDGDGAGGGWEWG
jgi:hypothetical protein